MAPLAEGLIAPLTPGGHPARWVATGRSGGVSRAPYDEWNLAEYVGDRPEAVEENLNRLCRQVGVAAGRLAIASCVHGADVAIVSEPGFVPGVDALVTQEPDLAVLARGADCAPIALIGDDGHTVAAVHCGWRGLVSDVLGSTFAVMNGLGAGVERAIVGPATCGACYRVSAERAVQVRVNSPIAVSRTAVVAAPDGQPGIDIRRGVVARLLSLGVPKDAIEQVGNCTIEDPMLFSFRRDGVTGRQGIAVARLAST